MRYAAYEVNFPREVTGARGIRRTRALGRNGYFSVVCVLLPALSYGSGLDADTFRTPTRPPRALYRADCTVDPARGAVEGTESISFTNDSARPIRRLVLSWEIAFGSDHHRKVKISVNGDPVSVVDGTGPVVFDLPQPMAAGVRVTIDVQFMLEGWETLDPDDPDDDEVISSLFLPRLDWGFETHDDYDVRLAVPDGYAVALSGRFDPESGRYRARNVRAFGIYLGRGHRVMEAMAGDVLVRAVYRPKAEACARLLLETAVDAIVFYRKRFGMYPQKILNIVPGMPYPAGGYPAATSIVVVHGQQQLDRRDELHWRWITAHEIGHQYWGEHVLERDDPSWLWIGLGVYADREYVRARGLAPDKHLDVMKPYIDGVREGNDTTLAITAEQHSRVSFDWNNVVMHGKGFSVISALACFLGQEMFDRVYARCLNEYAGRRLGAHEFQTVCEQETGQDLGWFFDQWVRSDRYLAYKIVAQKTKKLGDRYVARVRVARIGDLKMPVPIAARFADGSEQRRFTERLLEENVLSFESTSPLKEVVIDPDRELAMIIPPPPGKVAEQVDRAIRELPYTGSGDAAVGVYEKARELGVQSASSWAKLGLCLYDGRRYPAALDAFERAARQAGEGDIWGFAACVWRGHLFDLLDRRTEALEAYQEALRRDTGGTMQHGQYHLKIDRAWVEQRLETPFHRE